MASLLPARLTPDEDNGEGTNLRFAKGEKVDTGATVTDPESKKNVQASTT